MDIAISIIVTFVLTLANGYFSMSEMAISTAKKVMLDHDAEEGDTRAALAAKISDDPTEALAAIQVAITLVGFASSAFAATNLSEPFAGWMESLGMAEGVAAVLAPIIITLIVVWAHRENIKKLAHHQEKHFSFHHSGDKDKNA